MTLEIGKGNHPKFLPFAFTEHGVAMLSAVLNSQRAVNASIAIMRAFVMIRQWALSLAGSRLGIKSHIMNTQQHIYAFLKHRAMLS